MAAMFANGSGQNEQSIDASYQDSLHLAEGFQRRRLKCEKLTDDRRRTISDGKSCLTLPLARSAKKTIPAKIGLVVSVKIFVIISVIAINKLKKSIN